MKLTLHRDKQRKFTPLLVLNCSRLFGFIEVYTKLVYWFITWRLSLQTESVAVLLFSNWNFRLWKCRKIYNENSMPSNPWLICRALVKFKVNYLKSEDILKWNSHIYFQFWGWAFISYWSSNLSVNTCIL